MVTIGAFATIAAIAPKPLHRNPVYDGAADPTLIWNRAGHRWVMFYTNRLANADNLPGVSWVTVRELEWPRVQMAERIRIKAGPRL